MKRRTIVVVALIGASLASVLLWNWSWRPGTSSLQHAGSTHIPKASVQWLSPGVLRLAFESIDAYPAGLALQAGDTMVIAGTTSPRTVSAPASDSDRGVVVRLTADGRLANPSATLLADTPTTLSSVSKARDGTIVVAGYGSGAPQIVPGAATRRRFLIGRLRPDALPDDSFNGGIVLANVRPSWWAAAAGRAAAVQDDGKIVVTGTAAYATGPLSQGSYCATARLTREGRFDRTFGKDGRVLTLIGTDQSCSGMAVLVAPDRKIVVVGNTSARGFVVLRYRPDGSFDERFGTGGVAEFFDAMAWGATLDTHGRTVVVGRKWLSLTKSQLLVARYDTDGRLDQSFGAGGAVAFHDAGVSQDLNATVVQPDGKIVAVGTFGWHGGKGSPIVQRDEMVVARLNANGVLDQSFADGGLLLMASDRYLWGARAVAMPADGRLLIVGPLLDDGAEGRSSGIVVVKLNPDGSPDASFGTASH